MNIDKNSVKIHTFAWEVKVNFHRIIKTVVLNIERWDSMKNLTFKSLCKNLKNRPSLKNCAQELTTLTGAIASFIENPVTGSVLEFINTIAEKDKFINLGGTVLNAILSDKSADDYCRRMEQMREAYGIIYFTSFFDALDNSLPKNIRSSIALSPSEKHKMFFDSFSTNDTEHTNKQEIMFPDIVYRCDKVDEVLQNMYISMANRLRDFVRGLSFQEIAEEKDIRAFDDALKELPNNAVKRFHNQYLKLCSEFNEFYIFTQLEHEKEKELKWERRYKEILSIATRSQSFSETGLDDLEKVILSLPNQIKEEKVKEVVSELIKTYQKNIERPLIKTKDGDENLIYPPISTAFIPQAYKLMLYSKEERLGQLDTWNNIKSMKDMTSFWAKYCLDPNSVDNLLLVLGEPGIGKSLLTEVLCARMITPSNICIRIPLRDYDMEEEIETIVCKQIDRDGDASEPIKTFKSFAEGFKGSPIMLLFDGYDEVMQATGGVYRNLLMKIWNFQERCKERNRPVRIVITSRETLIDKANIPRGTTVMKLLEFDEEQKNRWIKIWNDYNHEKLERAQIHDFSLPTGNKAIEELSRQPLLLLMLAIYDANFEIGVNALKQANGEAENIDRMKLYDELLRRFIRRELRKGRRGQESAFENSDTDRKEEMVDEEMKKLGIAALGMFVREKLSLKVGELEDDLAYMKVDDTVYNLRNRKMLKNAEIIFGSFFFIHDLRTENEDNDKEAAFVFLHKTFYEFLVADSILFSLIDTTDKLSDIKRAPRRGKSHYLEALENPANIDNAYYVALNSSCLCTEPEIIEMISEWKDDKISKFFPRENDNFSDEMSTILSDIFSRHLDIIRTGVFAPLVDKNGGLAGGRDYLQACAVYLMNLLILRILISKECKIKVEEWSYISQFLKLNIPLFQETSKKETSEKKPKRNLKINPYEEIILKFMDLFSLKQNGDYIILTKKQHIRKFERNNLQEARIDVFDFMQDNVTRKVYQLHSLNNSLEQRDQYKVELRQQGFDFGFDDILTKTHNIVYYLRQCEYFQMYKNLIIFLDSTIHQGNNYLQKNKIDPSFVLDWLLCLSQIAEEKIQNFTFKSMLKNSLRDLGDTLCMQYNNKELISSFLEVIKKLNCQNILTRSHFLRYIFNRWPELTSDLLVLLIKSSANYQPYIQEPDFNYFDVDFRKLLDTNSLKRIAVILKFLYRSGRIGASNTDVIIIQDRLERYLEESPEELPELLEVFLQMGAFDEVKGFFSHIEEYENNWLDRLSKSHPESIAVFLNIAIIVGEDRNFSKCIEGWLKENFNIKDMWRIPSVIIKLAYYNVVNNANTYTSFAEDIFYKEYPSMFRHDLKEAICILYKMSQKQIAPNMYVKLCRACEYSLQRYNLVLEVSVTATAQILTLGERILKLKILKDIKYNTTQFQDVHDLFTIYETHCFNKALSTCDRSAISSLVDLLDAMNPKTRKAMKEYFINKLKFIKSYSWKLVDKVKHLYGLD